MKFSRIVGVMLGGTLLPQILCGQDTAVLNRLRDTSMEIRQSAAEQLGAAGPAAQHAVPALLAALQDPSEGVRATAAWALGKIQGEVPRTIAALIEALNDEDWTVRHNASLSLEWLHAAATLPLEKALADSRPRVSVYAAFTLHRIDPAAHGRVLPALTRGLEAEADDLRLIAVQTLGIIGPPSAIAVPQLIRLLSDKSPALLASATSALASIGPAAKDAVPMLRPFLQPGRSSHQRVLAVDALAKIGHDPESWIADAVAMFAPTREERIPDAAMHALARVGAPAVPRLIEALKHDESIVREFAAETLSFIGKPAQPAIPHLVHAMQDSSWQVRRKAAQALGNIGASEASAVKALKGTQTDANEEVRRAAQESLDKLTSRRDA